MKYKISIVLFLFLFSCKKGEKNSSVAIIGHGGMGLEFSGSIHHDNSEEAFNLALNIQDCEGIEMDVRMSKDGDLWAFHDENMKDETHLGGCIEESYFEKLNGTHYQGFGYERLKRLKNLDLVTHDKEIFMDIKHYNACSGKIMGLYAFLQAVQELPIVFQNKTRVYVILADKDWIPNFISAGYQVLFSSDNQSEIASVIQLNPFLTGIVIKNSNVSKGQVDQYLQQGKRVYLYDVRSPKKLREAASKNPTGVMSDDVQGAILEIK